MLTKNIVAIGGGGFGRFLLLKETIYFSISREPNERPNPPPPIATIFLLGILNKRFVYEFKTNYY